LFRKRVDRGAQTLLADVLLDLLDAAELETRLPPSLLRVHAGAHFLLRQEVEVTVQLLIQVSIERLLAEQRSERSANA